MRVERSHSLLGISPQTERALDALCAIGSEAALGCRHARRKNSEQYVTVVRFAKRVLQQREPLANWFERRVDGRKAFDCVSQALAGDSKIVEAGVIVSLESVSEGANFAQSRRENPIDELFDPCDAAKIDAIRLHVT